MASPTLRCARVVLAMMGLAVGVARAERLPVRRFDTAEGLASARVNGIASDTRSKTFR